jgi:hypothetical protein
MGTYLPTARRRGIPIPLIALALASLLVGALGSIALAAPPDEVPGNNGTIKIHDGAGEPPPEVRNEPHVCTFHLHFFFADAGDSGTWEIQEWAPGDKGTVVLTGTYTTDANGEDRDPDAGAYSLPDGHYKLFWDGDLDTNKHDKHKVFWVECEEQAVAPATPTPTPPNGAGQTPPTGGGRTPPTGGQPTPPSGGVGPTEGTAPTPPSGGVGPIAGTATPTPPSGAVLGAAGTPAVTLPPTDIAATESTAGSSGMWAALLLLLAIVTTVTMFTVPASVVQRSRRR